MIAALGLVTAAACGIEIACARAGQTLGVVVNGEARVLHVESDTVAGREGVQRGDLLKAFDGSPVASGNEARLAYQRSAAGKDPALCEPCDQGTRSDGRATSEAPPSGCPLAAAAREPVTVELERAGENLSLQIPVRPPSGSAPRRPVPTPVPPELTYL